MNKARGTLLAISKEARVVDSMLEDLHKAAVLQADNLRNINSVVSQLDQWTRENSTLVERSAADANSLTFQAQELAEVTEKFELTSSRP